MIHVYDSLLVQIQGNKYICEVQVVTYTIQAIFFSHPSDLQHVLRFLKWEHQSIYGEPLSAAWQTNLDVYLDSKVSTVQSVVHLTQAVYKVPQQPNATDCGLYVITFAECLCKGGNPGCSFYINAQDILNVRYKVIVRLSQEWVLQQALGHGYTIPPPESPRAPPLLHKPDPFPLHVSLSPPPIIKTITHHSLTDSPIPQFTLLESDKDNYIPALGTRRLWKTNHRPYYPAEVTAINIDDRLATLWWLDDTYVDPADPLGMLFTAPFTTCYVTLEDSLVNTLNPTQVRF